MAIIGQETWDHSRELLRENELKRRRRNISGLVFQKSGMTFD
jgi:hypothetical protein